MKRFIRSILLFLSCLLLLEVLLLVLLPSPRSRSSHEANVRLAAERMQQISQPKIVIIGGSGCQFAMRSDLLAEHYQMPVVNTGTHACIGLQLQVNLCRPYLQQGDIVLLIPEYDQYCVPELFLGVVDESMPRILLSNYPAGMRYLTAEQWWRVLPLLPKCIAKSIHSRKPLETWSPYSASGINAYGDATNWDYRPAVFQEHPSLNPLLNAPNKEVLQFIMDFANECSKHSVALYLLPPALAQSESDMLRDYIPKLEAHLRQTGIPFAVAPNRYYFPDSLFFDTYYHMTLPGATLRTTTLICDLDSIRSRF